MSVRVLKRLSLSCMGNLSSPGCADRRQASALARNIRLEWFPMQDRERRFRTRTEHTLWPVDFQR